MLHVNAPDSKLDFYIVPPPPPPIQFICLRREWNTEMYTEGGGFFLSFKCLFNLQKPQAKALHRHFLHGNTKICKAIMMFRICNNLIDILVSLFTPVAHYGHRSQNSFLIPYFRTDKLKNSCIPTGTKFGIEISSSLSSSSSSSSSSLLSIGSRCRLCCCKPLSV